jgi:hypothetical protein
MVARAFGTSRRRETLTFTHHREAASLPAVEADALLDEAEAEGWSTRQLRTEVAERRNAAANGASTASAEACTTADLAALAASGARLPNSARYSGRTPAARSTDA